MVKLLYTLYGYTEQGIEKHNKRRTISKKYQDVSGALNLKNRAIFRHNDITNMDNRSFYFFYYYLFFSVENL